MTCTVKNELSFKGFILWGPQKYYYEMQGKQWKYANVSYLFIYEKKKTTQKTITDKKNWNN